MKFFHPTALVLSLLATACVTPSASITDLTKKNQASAAVLAEAHEASLESMDQFIASVECAQLAYLKEARTKIERLTQQALRSRLDALGAEFRARFDDGLWDLRGQNFTDLVKSGFNAPLNKALGRDSQSVLALYKQAREYPDDMPLQADYLESQKAHEMAKSKVAEGEFALSKRAAKVTSSARKRFDEELDAGLKHYHLLLKGVAPGEDDSYSSILSAIEVERKVIQPVSYNEHRAALKSWSEESNSRLQSHLTALETVDRYLRGKSLSFLFVEGSEALAPLELPPVPVVSSLGLGDVLVQLRAREVALEGLAARLDEMLRLGLKKVSESLEAEVAKARVEVEGNLSFLDMPR